MQAKPWDNIHKSYIHTIGISERKHKMREKN